MFGWSSGEHQGTLSRKHLVTYLMKSADIEALLLRLLDTFGAITYFSQEWKERLR